jgi:hypothetical protein
LNLSTHLLMQPLSQPATRSRTWGEGEIRADPPTSLWWQISPDSRRLLIWIQTRGVSHYGLAIYIKKYLKAKEELRKLKYFAMQ